MSQQPVNRRKFFSRCTATGAAAGSGLFAQLALVAEAHDGGPLAPKLSHFAARAKQLVFVFLTGGFSHVDTFDPKPKLATDAGKTFKSITSRDVMMQPLAGSQFKFMPCADGVLSVSELFPKLGKVAVDLCAIRSMHTDTSEHFQATLAMHTGSASVPMPSIGCWLSYGLGTLNPNLPSYIVLAEHMPYAGAQVWDNNFLAPYHQGVRIVPGDEPIADLRPRTSNVTLVELEMIMLRDVNELHAASRHGDINLRARNHSFDVARGMMQEAPEVFDLSRESMATLTAYGLQPGDKQSFGAQCLMARRLVERGVRVVELVDTGSHDNWDAHGDMQQHRAKAARVDQPLASMLRDLRQRGLLQETLVAICTEFGRTPWSSTLSAKGRDHWHRAFTCLLAGAGVKGGMVYGQTDEYGIDVASDPCHVHDFHATILHLMGIDHERLTYRYSGRDFRLTDVAGSILQRILT
jgi:hypothetical protein